MRGEDAEPRGTLKVAAPIVFGRLHVLPIVNRVLHDYRDVAVELTLSDRNAHLVEEGVDVAVRIGELADSSLIAVKLGVVSRVVVASPAYLKERGVPKSPAELAKHDIIAFEGLTATDDWRFHGGGKPVRLEPRLTVNSVDASIAAAEAGIGITRTLSYQVQASVIAGRLTSILQSGLAEAPPHYHGHRERLRERFRVAGADALSDYELLEAVLFRAQPRRDVKPLAKTLMATFGSFAEVIAAPVARLAEVKGLGQAGITEIKIVQAAASRLFRGEVKNGRRSRPGRPCSTIAAAPKPSPRGGNSASFFSTRATSSSPTKCSRPARSITRRFIRARSSNGRSSFRPQP